MPRQGSSRLGADALSGLSNRRQKTQPECPFAPPAFAARNRGPRAGMSATGFCPCAAAPTARAMASSATNQSLFGMLPPESVQSCDRDRTHDLKSSGRFSDGVTPTDGVGTSYEQRATHGDVRPCGAQSGLRSGERGRGARLRDANRGRAAGYGMRRWSYRRRDVDLGGWSQVAVRKRCASRESGAIRAVGYRPLAGRRVIMVRGNVSGAIARTVLDNLAAWHDLDVRVSEDRR